MDSLKTLYDNYIDLTMLVPLPPNLINRDDLGLPKTIPFGGYERLSPSKASLARGVRRGSRFGRDTYRSARLPIEMAKHLGCLDDPEKVAALRLHCWNTAPKKTSKEGQTEGLLLFGAQESKDLAEILAPFLDDTVRAVAKFAIPVDSEEEDVDGEEAAPSAKGKKGKKFEDKHAKEIVAPANKAIERYYASRKPTIEQIVLALYGRMSTNTPLQEAPDAALQYARGISTQAHLTYSEFINGMDDKKEEDQRGAGFLGFRDFSPGSVMLLQIQVHVSQIFRSARVGHDFDDAITEVIMDCLETTIFRPYAGAAGQGPFRTSPRPFFACVQRPTRGCLYDMQPVFWKPAPPKATLSEMTDTLRTYMARKEEIYSEVSQAATFCEEPEKAESDNKSAFLEALEDIVATSVKTSVI